MDQRPRKPPVADDSAQEEATSHGDSSLIFPPFDLRAPAEAPLIVQPGTRRPLLDLFPPERTQPRHARGPSSARPPRPTASPAASNRRARRALREDETFFGFAEPPFELEPDVRFLYRSAEHDRVVRQITEAVAQRDPIVVVTGPTGVGKTILLKALVERHANALVVVDEAQNVPAEALTEFCARQQQAREALAIVLAGQPALTRLLDRPELRAVRQQLGLWAELGTLNDDEVAGYVTHRVNVASPNPRVHFDTGASDRLYQLSNGVPRTINQICDRALVRAFERSAEKIDRTIVDAAAWDVGLCAPQRGREAVRRAAIGFAFLLLVAVGAAAAAWLFRGRVHEILRLLM